MFGNKALRATLLSPWACRTACADTYGSEIILQTALDRFAQCELAGKGGLACGAPCIRPLHLNRWVDGIHAGCGSGHGRLRGGNRPALPRSTRKRHLVGASGLPERRVRETHRNQEHRASRVNRIGESFLRRCVFHIALSVLAELFSKTPDA